MSKPTALLVSGTPWLIATVQEALAALPQVQVEVCPSTQQACARGRRGDVQLILAEVAAAAHAAMAYLRGAVVAAGLPCPPLALCTANDHQGAALLRAGAAAYLDLPAELPRLAFLLA